jgi:hypothetical protein
MLVKRKRRAERGGSVERSEKSTSHRAERGYPFSEARKKF